MDHSDNDCLMIVIMTHGELVPLKDRKGKLFTTILTHDLYSYLHATDNKYPLQMIWENFTDDKCPSLRNKPRIFFIQACQGEDFDTGHPFPIVQNGRSIEKDVSGFQSTKHMPFEPVQLDRRVTLPQKDFLVVYSSMSGYYSYRDTVKGSWFVEALCKVLNERTDDLDIFGIVTLINQTVAYNYDSGDENAYKQMPCVVSMLTKLILFKKKGIIANGYQND